MENREIQALPDTHAAGFTYAANKVPQGPLTSSEIPDTAQKIEKGVDF
jgi:hypothetical protein